MSSKWHKKTTPAKEATTSKPSQEELERSWAICQEKGIKVEVESFTSPRPNGGKRGASSAAAAPPPAKIPKPPRSLPPTETAGPSHNWDDRHSYLSISGGHQAHFLDVTSLSSGVGKRLAMASSCPQLSCNYLVISNAPEALADEYAKVSSKVTAFGSSLQPWLPLGGQLINWPALESAPPVRSVALAQISFDEPFVHLCLPLQQIVVTSVPEAPKRSTICPVLVYLPQPRLLTPGPPTPHLGYYVPATCANRLRRAKVIGVVRFYVWQAEEVALACQHIQGALQDRLLVRYQLGDFPVLVVPSFMSHQLSLDPLEKLEIVFHVYIDAGDKAIPHDLLILLHDVSSVGQLREGHGAFYDVPGAFVLYASVQQFRNAKYDSRLSSRLCSSSSSSSALVEVPGLKNYGCLTVFTAGVLKSATLAQFLTFLASLHPEDNLAVMMGSDLHWSVFRALKIDSGGAPGFLVYSDAVMPDSWMRKAVANIPDFNAQILTVSPLEPHRLALMEHLSGVALHISSVGASAVAAASSGALVPPGSRVESGIPGITALSSEVGILKSTVSLLESGQDRILDRIGRCDRTCDRNVTSISELSDDLCAFRQEFVDSLTRLQAVEAENKRLVEQLRSLPTTHLLPCTPAAVALPGDGSLGGMVSSVSTLRAALHDVSLLHPGGPPPVVSSPSRIEVGRDLTEAADPGASASSGVSPWPQDLPESFMPSFIQIGHSLLDEACVFDSSLFIETSSGPDLIPSEDVPPVRAASAASSVPSPPTPPLHWRIVGLDHAGLGVSLHFPATAEAVRQLGDSGSFDAGIRALARVAVYISGENAEEVAPPSSDYILWEPTYLTGWFRCSRTITVSELSVSQLVGKVGESWMILPNPSITRLKALIQEVIRLHCDSLALTLSKLLPSTKTILVEAGPYSFRLLPNGATITASFSTDPSAAELVWKACGSCVASLSYRGRAEYVNSYNKFNIIHAVAAILHGRTSKDPAPAFQNADNTASKLAKRLRDPFVSLMSQDVPTHRQKEWTAFLDFLNANLTSAPNSSVTLADATLQDHLKDWGWDVPYFLHAPDAPAAKLESVGTRDVTIEGILALDNCQAILIHQVAPSHSSSSSRQSKGVAPVLTCAVTTLSFPVETIRSSLIAEVFSEVPDLRALEPQLRCIATLGPTSSDSVHE